MHILSWCECVCVCVSVTCGGPHLLSSCLLGAIVSSLLQDPFSITKTVVFIQYTQFYIESDLLHISSAASSSLDTVLRGPSVAQPLKTR